MKAVLRYVIRFSASTMSVVVNNQIFALATVSIISCINNPSMDLCNSGSLLIVSSIYFLCKRPNTGYLKYGKTTHPPSDGCGYSDWSSNSPTQTSKKLQVIKCCKQRSLRLLFMTILRHGFLSRLLCIIIIII